MTYGPDRANDKHANRRNGLLYNGHQQSKCLSRSHFMEADSRDPETHHTLKGAILPGQSMEINMGWDRFDPDQMAHAWSNSKSLLRVPKVAVLSSFINWWESWESCVFQAPCGPIFSSLCTPTELQIYNRIRQVNDNAVLKTGGDPWGAPWGSEIKSTVVGTAENKMQDFHQRFRSAARDAVETLASLKPPIYAVIPEWCPDNLPMKPNNLTQTKWVSSGKGTYANPGLDPQYLLPEIPYHWWFPNVNDSRSSMPFSYTGVPALTMPDPGFGVSVAHFYVGHWGHRGSFPEDQSVYKWESWPYGPPGSMIANEYQGMYLGHAIPGFNGARVEWHDCGDPYGYTGPLSDPYPYYQSRIEGDAEKLKNNFHKYRSFTTNLWTFPKALEFKWMLEAIKQDRLIYTSGVFWPKPPIAPAGSTWCDFGGNCTADLYMIGGDDGTGGFLAHGPIAAYDVAQATIDKAIGEWLPTIKKRIIEYYESLIGGTESLFSSMINQNDLGNYGFSSNGPAPEDMCDPDKLVPMIINQFLIQEAAQSMPSDS